MKRPSGDGGGIAKETFIGLLAVLWGGYNLLTAFNVIPEYINTANIQIVGNILLILAGFLLWATAYKLWRVRWHTKGLF
jgi:di/tricarboxylate transporter